VDFFFTEECGLPRNQAIFKKVYQLIFKEILLEAQYLDNFTRKNTFLTISSNIISLLNEL